MIHWPVAAKEMFDVERQHDGLGWHRVYWPGHLLWWALIIGGVIVLVRWLMPDGSRSGAASEDRALSILKERYARGEIDKVEFDLRKRDIA